MEVEDQMFKGMITCVRCGYPETSENIDFDKLGLCKACRSSEQKMKISWDTREKNLRKILDKYKTYSGDNYDCIVPISGGKDSAFQLYLLTEIYDLKPLAVTFSHNWFTETGRYNLQNILEKTNVDHLEFTPKRGLVNKLARESLYKIGDACWHCHTGVEAFPLNIACKFKIPLLIYGESVAENSGKATYLDNPDFSIDYFLQMSAKVKPEEMLCADISKKDLAPFKSPTKEEIEAVGLKRIFLGDFIFWDSERQTEFVRDYLDWKEEDVEGTYKQYKSVECIMPGVHDYAKYIKRGFGRGTDFAMQDVRAGLMTVEEANEIQKQTDPVKPKILSYYSKITGITEDKFIAVLEAQREDAAKRNLPATDEMTIDLDLPVNDTIQKILDPKSPINLENRRRLGLQAPRVFPNFGLMNQKAKKILKNYDIKKYKENDDTQKLHELTATQIVKRIKSKTISIEALVRSYYSQYKKVEESVNAWVEYDFENSLLQAKLLDYANMQNKFTGDISGLPFAIKDIFNTADYPTQMGSKSWKGFCPGNDARCVNKLRLEGSIILGKTVTAEFAIDHPGLTKNPYDLTRSPGTSSSGSAVAVATRMAPVSLGSQTAGSTIRPSSYVGIYGMKPSFGIIPRTGVLKTADTLDHITFMGLEVNDLRMALDTMRVRGKNYPFVNRYLENEANQMLNKNSLNIALPVTHAWNEMADYTKNKLQNFVNECSYLGHNVEEIRLPSEFEEAHLIHSIIYDKSISYYFKAEHENHSALISDTTRAMIDRGNQISADQYRTALSKQVKLASILNKLLVQYDIMVSNSTAEIAQKGSNIQEKIDPSLIWSLCLVPSVNLPAFLGPDDLPLGVQVIAARYRDYFLLNVCDMLVEKGLAPTVAPIPQLAL